MWFPRGWPSTALTPGYLIGSRFLLPALGRPKLSGIKTNAQPAPATSPCRSAHLLFMFLAEEMVGCHVSVSSHVMPLPALVHSLGHQFASDLCRDSQAHSTHQEGPEGESSPAHPNPCFPAARGSQTGLPRNGGASGPSGPVRCQQPASSLSSWPSLTYRTETDRRTVLLRGCRCVSEAMLLHLSLLFKANHS